MKTIRKRKTFVLVGALALALVMVLASTFAWFSAQDSVINRFATNGGLSDVAIKETFVPEPDWEPGETITKDVAVINTGDTPAIARIHFTELMSVNALISTAPTSSPNTFNPDVVDPYDDAADYNDFTPGMLKDVTAYTGRAADPSAVPPITAITTDYIKYTSAGAAQADLGDVKVLFRDAVTNAVITEPANMQIYMLYEPANNGSPASPPAPATADGDDDSWHLMMWMETKWDHDGDRASGDDPATLDVIETAPISVNQKVVFDYEWDKPNKTFNIKNVRYVTYEKTSVTSDWRVGKPAAADMGKSLAETTLNTDTTNYPDTVGHYNNNIQLNYFVDAPKDNFVTTLTPTPTGSLDKWYYNPVDGFFYFLGVSDAGEVTPSMLASLYLNGVDTSGPLGATIPGANSEYYSFMKYELTVNMSAIQITMDAIDAQWPEVNAAGNEDLKAALQVICDEYADLF